jgi:16S rRNA (cytidine1402-2'-O)-methyltransferase
MRSQKSFHDEERGMLYLVPTPIGNLEDMTFRAVRILKEVNVIAAEDTRNSKKLCNYFEINTPLVSYHEHNKKTSGHQLIERILRGEHIALISDAGMPSISDPGYELVVAALEEEIPVIPLPGANAALTSLIASGLLPQPFYFYGFLNRQKKERKNELEKLKKLTSTFILYESPHRIKETLKDLAEQLGNRRIVLSRELTKKFEEFIRGTLEEAIEWSQTEEIRGEFCLVIEGASLEEAEIEEEIWWSGFSVEEHVTYYIEEKKLTSKEAIKQTAVDRDVSKRDIYQAYHV